MAQEASRPPERWLLWLSFLGAPALWLGHFLLAYLLSEAACNGDGSSSWPLGLNGLLLLLTLLFVAASFGLTLLAYRLRQRVTRTPPVFDDFLPRLGFVTGLLFTFILSFEFIPIFMLGGCR